MIGQRRAVFSGSGRASRSPPSNTGARSGTTLIGRLDQPGPKLPSKAQAGGRRPLATQCASAGRRVVHGIREPASATPRAWRWRGVAQGVQLAPSPLRNEANTVASVPGSNCAWVTAHRNRHRQLDRRTCAARSAGGNRGRQRQHGRHIGMRLARRRNTSSALGTNSAPAPNSRSLHPDAAVHSTPTPRARGCIGPEKPNDSTARGSRGGLVVLQVGSAAAPHHAAEHSAGGHHSCCIASKAIKAQQRRLRPAECPVAPLVELQGVLLPENAVDPPHLRRVVVGVAVPCRVDVSRCRPPASLHRRSAPRIAAIAPAPRGGRAHVVTNRWFRRCPAGQPCGASDAARPMRMPPPRQSTSPCVRRPQAGRFRRTQLQRVDSRTAWTGTGCRTPPTTPRRQACRDHAGRGVPNTLALDKQAVETTSSGLAAAVRASRNRRPSRCFASGRSGSRPGTSTSACCRRARIAGAHRMAACRPTSTTARRKTPTRSPISRCTHCSCKARAGRLDGLFVQRQGVSAPRPA